MSPFHKILYLRALTKVGHFVSLFKYIIIFSKESPKKINRKAGLSHVYSWSPVWSPSKGELLFKWILTRAQTAVEAIACEILIKAISLTRSITVEWNVIVFVVYVAIQTDKVVNQFVFVISERVSAAYRVGAATSQLSFRPAIGPQSAPESCLRLNFINF